jgi:hypothetical protein
VGYDTVNYVSIGVGSPVLYSRCFNREVATRASLDRIEHVGLEPVKLSECNVVSTRFICVPICSATSSCWRHLSFATAPGGYEFRIVGDPREDLFSLCEYLVGKMRLALAVMHVRRSRLGLEIVEGAVRGRMG